MHNKNSWVCPVCGFNSLDEPPYDEEGCATFSICPCCGNEFGYDDASAKYSKLRKKWIEEGMVWWSETQPPPANWDPIEQLKRADMAD